VMMRGEDLEINVRSEDKVGAEGNDFIPIAHAYHFHINRIKSQR
jgi:hypothetical protein